MMSLEKRKDSRHRYYCRTARRNGRLVREYIGAETDPVVRIIAREDALSRAEAAAAVAKVRAEQAAYNKVRPLLDTLAAGVQEAQEIILLVCGCRQRKGRLQAVKYREPKPAQADYSDSNEPLTQELFDYLVQRANRGDRKAAVRLRQIVQVHPEIWKDIGDLAEHAKRSLIGLIAKGNPVLDESLTLQMQDLAKSLRHEACDQTLEGLVIDHILVCWLELYFVRTAAMQPQRCKTDRRYWDRRLDKAHIRFHLAVRDLAALRNVIGDDAGVVSIPVGKQDES